MPTVLDEIVVTAQKREENIQEVPVAITTLSAEELELLRGRRRRRQGAFGPRAQPDARVLVRPRLPALLHPRPRQHRLRPQRLAAGLDDGRRGRAREPGGQGHAAVRPRARRGAARAAGDALRAQHPGRRGQVRHPQAVAGVRGLLPGLLRHLRHHRRQGRGRRRADRHPLGALLGALPVAERLDRQHLHRREGRARRLRDHGLPPAVPLGAEREVQAPCSTSTAGSSTAPRASSAPTSSRRAPTTWSTASTGQGLPRRPQPAGDQLPWAACSSSSTTSAPPP